MFAYRWAVVLSIVFGFVFVFFWLSAKPVFAGTCSGSGIGSVCPGNTCQSSGHCSTEQCSAWGVGTMYCSGGSASTCKRIDQRITDTCEQYQVGADIRCNNTGIKTQYTNEGCVWSGGPAPPPSCTSYRSAGQSCGGSGQCCTGGTNCTNNPCGSGYVCAYSGCATSGQSGCQYSTGCCSPLEPNAYTVCACPAVNPPSGLTPANGSLICSGDRVMTWNSPAGKFDVRVNMPSNPPSDWTALCESPNGKNGTGNECFDNFTSKSYAFDFNTKGEVYDWWVHAKNACTSSDPTHSVVTVAESPSAPYDLDFYYNGSWHDPGSDNEITIPPQSNVKIQWNQPSNASKVYNLTYTLYINNITDNGWNGCSDPYSGDRCISGLTDNEYDNFDIASGKTYNITVYAKQSCSSSEGYHSTASVINVVNPEASCSKPSGFPDEKITSIRQTDMDPFDGETYTYTQGGVTYPAIYTRDAKIYWQPPDSWGCSTGRKYSIVIYRSGDANDAYYDFDNLSSGLTSLDMVSNPDPDESYKLNRNGYFTVKLCAHNSAGYNCAWKDFYKSPYRTGVITGSLYNYDPDGAPNKCAAAAGIIKKPTKITALAPTDWKLDSSANTTTCTINPGSESGVYNSYTCTIDINNNTNDMYGASEIPEDVPSIKLQVDTTGTNLKAWCPNNVAQSQPYSCTSDQTVIECPQAPAGKNVSGLDLIPYNSTPITSYQNVYLEQDSSGDPEDPAGRFFKLKNASYYARGVIQSDIPRYPQAFDTIDDEEALPYLISGDSAQAPEGKKGVGVVTSPTDTNLYLGQADTLITYKNWKNLSYGVDSASFDAVKDRIVSSGADKIDNFSSYAFLASGAYYYEGTGDVIIGTGGLGLSSLNNKKITLAVDLDNNGKVIIASDIAPTTGYFMLVAKNITLNTGVKNLNGIYAADSIDLGGGINELKVKGNLVTFQSTLSNYRKRANSLQPSMFVVFDPVYYIKLLPQVATPTRRYTIKQ